MGTKEVAESYARTFAGFREIVVEKRTSALTRLVWFVAIAGYTLVNGKSLWEAMGARQYSGISLLWLSLPWVVTALLAVVSHFFIDEASVKDDEYYVKKMAAIDLQLEAIKEGDDKIDEMLQIINDTHPDIHDSKKASDRWGNTAKWLERATFAALVLGFVWSILGPYVIR